MPLKIIRADITKLKVDAIVNPTDIEFNWKDIVINIDKDFDVINERKT